MQRTGRRGAPYIAGNVNRNRLIDALHPSMAIGRDTALDIDQFRPQLLRHLARAPSADGETAVFAVDATDGRYDCSGATGEGFD